MEKYAAQKRYREKNIVHCTFDLNKATDADLLEHIQKQPNRAAYLKSLIRRDLYEYAAVDLAEDSTDA